jgi:hypothetical protein
VPTQVVLAHESDHGTEWDRRSAGIDGAMYGLLALASLAALRPAMAQRTGPAVP